MGARDEIYRKYVSVRCLNPDCGTEYTATKTVYEMYSDERYMGRREDPPSGLCPRCGRHEKVEI